MRLINIAEEKKIGGIDYLLASWQIDNRPIKAWIPLKDFLIIAHKASNSGTGMPEKGKSRKIKKRVKPKLVDSETERDQASRHSHSKDKDTNSGKRNPLELPELEIPQTSRLKRIRLLEGTYFGDSEPPNSRSNELFKEPLDALDAQELEEKANISLETQDTSKIGSLLNLCRRREALAFHRNRCLRMRSTTKEAAPYSFASSILSDSGNKGMNIGGLPDPSKNIWVNPVKVTHKRRNMVGLK